MLKRVTKYYLFKKNAEIIEERLSILFLHLVLVFCLCVKLEKINDSSPKKWACIVNNGDENQKDIHNNQKIFILKGFSTLCIFVANKTQVK